MRAPDLDERAETLRRTIAGGQLRLRESMATLRRVGAREMTIGGQLGKDPWPWLAGACVVGLIVATCAGTD